MADVLLWAVCLILGVPCALLIIGNWLIVIGAGVETIRHSKSKSFSFCPPFLCGIVGGVAVLVCPWPGSWRWAWLPLILDPSVALLLLCVPLHVIGRIAGLPSPFDGRPPAPESSGQETKIQS